MSVQDIADFEAQLQKLCEFWKKKLSCAEITGTLDTIKTIFQIERYNELVSKEPEVVAPVQELGPGSNGSPIPTEVADG